MGAGDLLAAEAAPTSPPPSPKLAESGFEKWGACLASFFFLAFAFFLFVSTLGAGFFAPGLVVAGTTAVAVVPAASNVLASSVGAGLNGALLSSVPAVALRMPVALPSLATLCSGGAGSPVVLASALLPPLASTPPRSRNCSLRCALAVQCVASARGRKSSDAGFSKP